MTTVFLFAVYAAGLGGPIVPVSDLEQCRYLANNMNRLMQYGFESNTLNPDQSPLFICEPDLANLLEGIEQ